MKFSIGSDPELVLMKDEMAYSAIPIVKASKKKRKRVGECAFFYDNVLAECEIPPAHSKQEFVRNIGNCLQEYANIVKPYKIVAKASHVFTKDQLTHKAAKEVGCTPEGCAYAIEVVKPDETIFQRTNLRSAGGHIHLGAPQIKEGFNRLLVIRLLDLFLGVPSVYMDHDPTSQLRKELYGKAGRFREPIYGVEYRTIGNFWLSSPKLVEVVYDICAFVLTLIEDGRAKEFWEIDEERLKSPEAWADRNFRPVQCHHCKYDVDSLRLALDTMDKEKCLVWMEMIKGYLSEDIINQISILSEAKQFDLYREWNLK